MLGFMAAALDEEVSGLALLRQPATVALARYLNDLGCDSATAEVSTFGADV